MKTTTNFGLKKPEGTDYINVNDLNENADKIDTELKSHADSLAEFSTHLADKANQIDLEEVEKLVDNYNSYASSPDANGIYTVVEHKRVDATLYMKSTLSNADMNGNYQTDMWQLYDNLGTTVISTLTWTLTYDADGKIISKVVV